MQSKMLEREYNVVLTFSIKSGRGARNSASPCKNMTSKDRSYRKTVWKTQRQTAYPQKILNMFSYYILKSVEFCLLITVHTPYYEVIELVFVRSSFAEGPCGLFGKKSIKLKRYKYIPECWINTSRNRWRWYSWRTLLWNNKWKLLLTLRNVVRR